MKKQASAPDAVTAQPSPPRYADYLAQLRAKSVGAGILAAGLLVTGGLLADALDANASMVPFVALAAVLAVYGVYLWAHVDAVTRDLWRREIAKNEDIDGDGNVGPPRRSVRYINIGGIPEPFAEEVETEVVDEVPGFGIEPDDLVALVQYAAVNGLGRSKLMGLVLPSGAKVGKATWERWNSEAGRRGWIKPGGDGYGAEWICRPTSIVQAIVKAAQDTGNQTGNVGGPVHSRQNPGAGQGDR